MSWQTKTHWIGGIMCDVPPSRGWKYSRFVNAHGWNEWQNSEGPKNHQKVLLVNYILGMEIGVTGVLVPVLLCKYMAEGFG